MEDYYLSRGHHPDGDDGRCAMEWIAWLAGEPHSDSPACVDSILRYVVVPLNDQLNDVARQRLRPYLSRMIGTAGDGRHTWRYWRVFDWVSGGIAAHAEPAVALTLTRNGLIKVLCPCKDEHGMYTARYNQSHRTIEECFAFLDELLPGELIELPEEASAPLEALLV